MSWQDCACKCHDTPDGFRSAHCETCANRYVKVVVPFDRTNPNIPAECRTCGRLLLLENLYVDDGCPCNSPRGNNFQPMACSICRQHDCVKPGHRLGMIFGAVPSREPTEPMPIEPHDTEPREINFDEVVHRSAQELRNLPRSVGALVITFLARDDSTIGAACALNVVKELEPYAVLVTTLAALVDLTTAKVHHYPPAGSRQ